MAAPTLDGHAHGTHSTSGNLTVALTTSLTNDIIVVMVYNEHNGGASAVSSVTSPGLAFAQRSSSNGSGNGSLEVWWALAATALTAATITVAFSSTYDDASCVAFGVHGCNTSAPWDGNASLPKKASFTASSSTPSVTRVSTTLTNNYLIAAIGACSGTGFNTPISGWSVIDSAPNSG